MCIMIDYMFNFIDYRCKWKMSFNPSKCSVMEISLKREPPHRDNNFWGQVLQSCSSHPYLGFSLTVNLLGMSIFPTASPKQIAHLECYGEFGKNLWFCPKEGKTTAYTPLVRPIIEYASCAWDPYQGSINKLDRVQRETARKFCIGDYKGDSSVSQMLKNPEWDILETRRERNRLAVLYKIQNSLVGINKKSCQCLFFSGE